MAKVGQNSIPFHNKSPSFIIYWDIVYICCIICSFIYVLCTSHIYLVCPCWWLHEFEYTWSLPISVLTTTILLPSVGSPRFVLPGLIPFRLIRLRFPRASKHTNEKHEENLGFVLPGLIPFPVDPLEISRGLQLYKEANEKFIFHQEKWTQGKIHNLVPGASQHVRNPCAFQRENGRHLFPRAEPID